MAGLPRDSHDALHARWSDDGAVPRNYGDPAAEYDAARSAAAVTDRGERAFVRVYGRDPVRMVQGLISNDVEIAGADRAVYAAVLTPKGRMVADVRVVRRDDELLLETAAAALPPLLAHLRKFVPPLYARIEDVTAAWSELSVYGPRALDTARGVLGSTVSDAEDAVTMMDDVIAVGSAYAGESGVDMIVPAERAVHVWQQLIQAGARPVGHATLDVLRIEAGRPRWGAELDENTIPLEAGLRARAISETKGCYTGQEVIIRILHRGHVNWQLRGVRLGDVSVPARDAPLIEEAGERRVGRITSAAWSPRQQQTIALAYVRREVEPPANARLGSAAGPVVTVCALPFPAAQ
ncbi:MAG TPA: glycine cleavage T C-terminal barrel domain-containing protein [Longimicrobiales bacterium]|nr:glycine cleavage T C-terminal barrel domain-containing protein [Longimicrobiales bacterium]